MRACRRRLPRRAWIDRYHLCFALGKALEDRGDFAESFRYYERGNALKRAESRYRPEIIETNTRQQIEVCTRGILRRAARLRRARSGSDLHRRPAALRLDAAGADPGLALAGRRHAGAGRHPQIVRSCRAATPTRQSALSGRAGRTAAEDFCAWASQYLADTRVYRTGKPFFIDKMPNNFRHLGLIHLMLPNAKIIDARREPMACCFSNFKQLFAKGQEFTYSIEDIARYYRTYLELMRHWDAVLPGRILRVQHEDVVDDLEGNVRRMLDFCGLPFEPACVEFHKTERSVRTASSEQVRQPIFREGLDQWKHFRALAAPGAAQGCAGRFELRRVEEAAASYRRALELQPRWVPAHLGLALVLRQQRRAAEAESSCRAALTIEPDNVEALASLGELLADRGKFAEAEPLFERAIAINPDFAPAYASIASHRRMTGADAAWRIGAERLLGGRVPLAHEISLHYALGKYFDDLGQYDDAFGHFRQANELTRRLGAKYDRARLVRRVDEIIARFGAASIDAPATEAQADAGMSELPVLIIGMPRSGTSLAEQILASHPDVYGAGEVIYWNGSYDRFRRAEAEGQSAAGLLAGMREEYLARLHAVAGAATRVVDKMPGNFLYAGLIHAALPRARIIHMQRHPFDTCLSIYFQNFYNIGPYANDLEDLAHYYAQYLRITDHWRATLPAANLLEVPYESLVADPDTWSRRMVDFMGLAWDPRCLEFHKTDRVVITASKWQVRQKISTKSAGRWRNYEKFIAPLQPLQRLLEHN
jgi:tetratricopeptide (TPR) repeat protein